MRINTEADIFGLQRGAQALAVIGAWARGGHFEQLADGEGRRLDEFSGDRRALEITARILAGLGLLATDGERWKLTRVARDLHASGALSKGEVLDTLGDLSRLAPVLESGGPVRDAEGRSRISRGGVREDDPEGSRRFMDMLARRSAGSAEETVFWITRHVASGGSVLDLGGGHGVYARLMADRGLRATVFDVPICIGFARERHGDAIEYRSGDFFSDDLGGPYDAVLASNIVHGFPAEENRRLLSRVRSSMAAGGVVVLKDMFLDPTGVGPEMAAIFGLTMLSYTEGGATFRLDEVDAWMREAGFEPLRPVAAETFVLAMGRAV